MKKILLNLSLLFSLFGFTAQAKAIQFWHNGTIWAGQGMCSAGISFDAGWLSDAYENVSIKLDIYDSKKEKLDSDVIDIELIGGSNSMRYVNAFIESEEICKNDLTIVVKSAFATINGERKNIINFITVKDFKPMKIVVKPNNPKRR